MTVFFVLWRAIGIYERANTLSLLRSRLQENYIVYPWALYKSAVSWGVSVSALHSFTALGDGATKAAFFLCTFWSDYCP